MQYLRDWLLYVKLGITGILSISRKQLFEICQQLSWGCGEKKSRKLLFTVLNAGIKAVTNDGEKLGAGTWLDGVPPLQLPSDWLLL